MVDLSIYVRELAQKLKIPESEIDFTKEYFPYVFSVRNPVSLNPECDAIGAFFYTLGDVRNCYDDCGWGAIEEEMDVALHDCTNPDEIYAYFYEWPAYDKEDATNAITQYKLKHLHL